MESSAECGGFRGLGAAAVLARAPPAPVRQRPAQTAEAQEKSSTQHECNGARFGGLAGDHLISGQSSHKQLVRSGVCCLGTSSAACVAASESEIKGARNVGRKLVAELRIIGVKAEIEKQRIRSGGQTIALNTEVGQVGCILDVAASSGFESQVNRLDVRSLKRSGITVGVDNVNSLRGAIVEGARVGYCPAKQETLIRSGSKNDLAVECSNLISSPFG